MSEEPTTKPARAGRGKRAGAGAGAAGGKPARAAAGGGKAARTGAANANAGPKAGPKAGRPGKADTSVRDVLYTVSRVSGGFEALLKTATPALTLSQWALLETLSKDSEVSRPSQVSRKLGVSRQSTRQANKKLTKLGLVEGVAAEEGKKAVGLRLTDAGRAKLDEIDALTRPMAEALSAGKRPVNLSSAVKTLRGLSSAVADQTPKPAKKPKGERKKGAADATADVAPTSPATEA